MQSDVEYGTEEMGRGWQGLAGGGHSAMDVDGGQLLGRMLSESPARLRGTPSSLLGVDLGCWCRRFAGQVDLGVTFIRGRGAARVALLRWLKT